MNRPPNNDWLNRLNRYKFSKGLARAGFYEFTISEPMLLQIQLRERQREQDRLSARVWAKGAVNALENRVKFNNYISKKGK